MAKKISIYEGLQQKKAAGKKSFAVLIDPDKVNENSLATIIKLSSECAVDYLFVGGSLVITSFLEDCIKQIKSVCDIPVVLFPGSPAQICRQADALLYLSLISGRNAEMLIGQHVVSAPAVKQSGLEVISTGYMVIDGGTPTTVSYMSNAAPMPSDKKDIASCTAMAGEMLGMKLIYMDAGSGAKNPVSEKLIGAVHSSVNIPLVVGGGITNAEKAYNSCMAGADVIVVGNAIEKAPELIREMATAIHSFNNKPVKR